MTSAQVIETAATNNSSFQNYPHPDDHTIRTTNTPGFKPFTILIVFYYKELKKRHEAQGKDDGRTRANSFTTCIFHVGRSEIQQGTGASFKF